MHQVLILVEGYTEERFVKTVLVPYLLDFQINMIPTIITTKRVITGSNYKGGLLSFAQLERELKLLFHSSNTILFTTFIDYYGLPTDFPGLDTAASDPYQRVKHVERELSEALGDPRFLPFVMLHEFEAFCFVDPAEFMECEEKASELAVASLQASGPEKINQQPATHPAQRIESSFPSYDKVIDGVAIAELIGVDKLRDACPHFRKWLDQVVGQAKA
ncbi:MAG: DUF4276 family protein [Caldilineaceae bacterium SB0666_bin_21]|nr:DUF4276 family protein [Caldilineaceae bacterium SB0666_bin_21]